MRTEISAVIPNTVEAEAFVVAEQWTRVTVIKETSGIVVIGTKEQLLPVTSGHGMQVPADKPLVIYLAPGTRLYAQAADSAQRLSYILQRLPYFEMLDDALGQLVTGLKLLVSKAFGK